MLGLLLAWLVLPFATLTQTGLPPIPAPEVIVPWEAIVPIYLGAVVLFILSLWLVRRQLPDIRISGVLRPGRAEPMSSSSLPSVVCARTARRRSGSASWSS